MTEFVDMREFVEVREFVDVSVEVKLVEKC